MARTQLAYTQLDTQWTSLGSIIGNKYTQWPICYPETIFITNRGLYPFLAVESEKIEVESENGSDAEEIEDETEDETVDVTEYEYPMPTTNAGTVVEPGKTYRFTGWTELWLKALNLPTDINISDSSTADGADPVC